MDDLLLFSLGCVLPVIGLAMVGGLLATISSLRTRVELLERGHRLLSERVQTMTVTAPAYVASGPTEAPGRVSPAPTPESVELTVPVTPLAPPHAETQAMHHVHPAESTPARSQSQTQTQPQPQTRTQSQPQSQPQNPHAQPQPTQTRTQSQPQQSQPQDPHAQPQPTQPQAQPEPEGFDWERWLGVRGAAALGGVVLTLAAAYFFKYSLEVGLIGPLARVLIGGVVGVGCWVAAEGPLRARYRVLGAWLAGAGGAVLYLSLWAATSLYDLVPQTVGFLGMSAVTAVCCTLAVRRDAPAIAFLAFLGGFATPALLSTGSDRPLELFSYLLVLNGGLLVVARARGWSLLPLLSLGGTTLYQLFWITTRMGDARALAGIGVVLLFSLVFAAGARPQRGEEDGVLWRLSRIGAVATPFVFALYFALLVDLGPHLWPIGAMLLVLAVGASILAERDDMRWLGLAVSAGSLAVVAAWTLGADLDTALAWETVGVLAALAAVFHAFAERNRTDDEHPGFAAALFTHGALVAAGALALAGVEVAPWPFLALLLLGTLGVMRQARLGILPPLQVVAAATVGASLAALQAVRGADAAFPSYFVVVVLGFAALWHLAALRGDDAARPHAAQVMTLLGVGSLLVAHQMTPLLLLGALVVLGVASALAALRHRQHAWLAGGMVVVASTLAARVWGGLAEEAMITTALVTFFAMLGYMATAFVHREQVAAWRVGGIAPVVFFPALQLVHHEAFGSGSAGLPALVVGVLAALLALAARALGPDDEEDRDSALVWPAVTSIGFLTAAVPMQLENEWVTVTWALMGAGVLALREHVVHRGLEVLGLGLLGAVFVRLVLNPALLGYHAPSDLPFLNWIAYTYLVPVVAILFSAGVMKRLDQRFLQRSLVLAAITLGFVFLNVTIIDAFSTGTELRLPTHHQPARDLSLSVAWALYGLFLLGAGIVKKDRGLRALGPGLVAITSAKVFLYDLGHLADLWRVASLVGLAISLILVSLAYQRFVFGGREDRPELATS